MTTVKNRVVNEILYFSILLVVGTLILPGAIYLVGGMVFGGFEGGFAVFFGGLMSGLIEANGATWFLVLSPYLAIQIVRLSLLAIRKKPHTE